MRPHAICIPYPAQGHINAMLSLAKLLHHKGFHITYVLTELNYANVINSNNFNHHSITNSRDFRIETIPDGLPPRQKPDTALTVADLCFSIAANCSAPFRELICRLDDDDDVPPVSCVVSDAFMPFTAGVADEVGIPAVMFWPMNATASMLHIHSPELREKISKNKDSICDDYIIDWVPEIESIRLAEIPTSAWSTDPNDPFIDYIISVATTTYKAKALIIHTFDELEHDVCNALSTMFNSVYTIGPIPLLLLKGFPQSDVDKIGCQLWKQDHNCIQWLDSKDPKSIVYVNFGSLTVTTVEKLTEFAMGLCNSMQNFLWVIRPESVSGGDGPSALPPGFMDEVRGRGYITGWCDQEQVLNHPSVGGFLTHCGWNSVFESISAGVPMICWAFFADQLTNRFCCCCRWRIGLEMKNEVDRVDVERVVRELMEGENGKEVRRKALFWKERAEEATSVGGSSFENLDKLIGEVLLSDKVVT